MLPSGPAICAAASGGITSVPRRDAASALRQLENRTAGVRIRVGGDSSLSHETSVYRKLMVHRPAKNPGRRGHSKARFSAHRPRRRGTDVIPSLAEGFGLPAVEAAACGAPLVLSDLEAHRETSGDAALYFSPTDRRALTEVLARVAGDDALQRDLSAKALAASRTRTWDAAADALARLVAGTARAG